MFKTLDLKTLEIATADVASAVETFRESFGFAVARATPDRAALAVGPAEIEMFRATGEESGLHAVVLKVDSLEEAAKALESRGYAAARGESNGRPALRIGPDGAHGARIVLVEA